MRQKLPPINMWFSKEVPLPGLVNIDTTMKTITTKLEFVASGGK